MSWRAKDLSPRSRSSRLPTSTSTDIGFVQGLQALRAPCSPDSPPCYPSSSDERFNEAPAASGLAQMARHVEQQQPKGFAAVVVELRDSHDHAIAVKSKARSGPGSTSPNPSACRRRSSDTVRGGSEGRLPSSFPTRRRAFSSARRADALVLEPEVRQYLPRTP